MAPTRPAKAKKKRNGGREARVAGKQAATVNTKQLLALATKSLQQGDALDALASARAAYEHIGRDGDRAGAVLSLLGEIHVEMGEMGRARQLFEQAVEADEDGLLPEELGGGPEKFLWLAQLSEDGGQDSVTWYERGAAALRKQIQALSEASSSSGGDRGGGGSGSKPLSDQQQQKALAVVQEKKRKLAETLCAVAEVYMTDLSWEADAEQRCEALVTEATMLAPELAEAWQTVANVRISQQRTDDARAALERSLQLWKDLAPEDPAVPAFPTRVSLARLLIEVELEETALEVTERLILEDDSAIEAWYLGGYASYILGEKLRESRGDDGDGTWKAVWRSARRWLLQALLQYKTQQYEDERLHDHAEELRQSIDKALGETPEDYEKEGSGDDDDDDDDDDEDGWEDTDNGEDKEETMDTR